MNDFGLPMALIGLFACACLLILLWLSQNDLDRERLESDSLFEQLTEEQNRYARLYLIFQLATDEAYETAEAKQN